MTLKRKRSIPELCSSPSSSSTFSSPPSNGTFTMDIRPYAFLPVPTPRHLHSRTMKRYRDNRPSENEIHQRTLNLLYSAQQDQHYQTTTTPFDDHPCQVEKPPHDLVEAPEDTGMSANHQQSLHRFWNINTQPTTTAPTSITRFDMGQVLTTTCEDCGNDLAQSISDNSMGLDSLEHGATCSACGKHVCFSCSVSNLGVQKRCLQCAGGGSL